MTSKLSIGINVVLLAMVVVRRAASSCCDIPGSSPPSDVSSSLNWTAVQAKCLAACAGEVSEPVRTQFVATIALEIDRTFTFYRVATVLSLFVRTTTKAMLYLNVHNLLM